MRKVRARGTRPGEDQILVGHAAACPCGARRKSPSEIFSDHLQIRGSNILRRPDQGAEGKADCAASTGGISASHTPLLAFRKAERGRGKKASMKGLNTPATAKEGYLPHDCKQYGFPSATLKSLDIQNMSVPRPVTNLEVIHFFNLKSPFWNQEYSIRRLAWKG